MGKIYGYFHKLTGQIVECRLPVLKTISCLYFELARWARINCLNCLENQPLLLTIKFLVS